MNIKLIRNLTNARRKKFLKKTSRKIVLMIISIILLHTLSFLAFLKFTTDDILYYIVGIFPVLTVISYAIIEYTSEKIKTEYLNMKHKNKATTKLFS